MPSAHLRARATRATLSAATAAFALAVMPLTPATAEGVDVSSFRNHNGICETPTDTCNFDDGGYSYSALANTVGGTQAGAEVTADGFTYTWPDVPAGAADNITLVNQVIPVDAGDATRIGLLGASHNGPVSGTFILHYTDADGQLVKKPTTLRFSDWTLNGGGANPLPGNVIAMTAPARAFSGAALLPDTTHAYSLAIPVDPALTLIAIEMPRERGIHLFDIAVA